MHSTQLKRIYNDGTRVLVYPNGHRTELRMTHSGFVIEVPVETEEEKRMNKINLLRGRIARDTQELKKLESKNV